MYFIYNIILTILALILSPVILVLFALKPKLRAGFWQKIGLYKIKLSKPKTIWIHAVSVGEVNAVEGFVKRAYQELENCNIVLSTVTRTGNAVAQQKLGKFTDSILYFPYDFAFSTISAINAIKPDAVIIAETEIWPNFSNELNKRDIPLMIINGRISPNSYKGYKKFEFFFKQILSKYTLILMQSESDKQRITDIGAPSNKTEVMGNLKYDITRALTVDEENNLKQSLKTKGKDIFIAASTHQGEDEIVLDSYKELKSKHDNLKLLLAPRHPERNSNVLELISKTGYTYGQRSKDNNFEECDIILLDTMGELGKLYSIAKIAFIGGSFSNTGGHNPLEAAIYNVPTVSGPTVFNFKEVYTFLTEANASIIVDNGEELTQSIDGLLTDTEKYSICSNSCKAIFEQNGGALEIALNKLKSLI